MNSIKWTVMDEQWHVNSDRWIVNFSLLTQIFEESSVEFKGLKFESLGHIIGVFWGIFRRVQISEIWESRPYYWCQKEPIKRNQYDHFFRSIVFLCQMRAIYICVCVCVCFSISLSRGRSIGLSTNLIWKCCSVDVAFLFVVACSLLAASIQFLVGFWF